MSGAKLISFRECCSFCCCFNIDALSVSDLHTFFQQRWKLFRQYFCPGCGTLEQFHIHARVASGVCFYFLQMMESYWNYQTVTFNSHLDSLQPSVKHLGWGSAPLIGFSTIALLSSTLLAFFPFLIGRIPRSTISGTCSVELPNW